MLAKFKTRGFEIMKKQGGFKKINTVVIVFAAFAVFAMQAQASVKTERFKNAIIQKLTEKLRVDLADATVEVKLNDVRDNEISKNQMNFDGKALAVVKDDKTALPFNFTATANLSKQNIEDVSYQFVEVESEFAPSMTEDFLMRDLMQKISEDYKTTNIVMSIDGFDSTKTVLNQTNYEGTGEVRIGDFEWRKIKFNVVLDAQTQTPTRILYELQK